MDSKVKEFNKATFIEDDPICIPLRYSKLQDVELTAFWSSMLAWGQRKTIINKSTELFGLMGGSPHEFIVNHKEKDRIRFAEFKHRTFQYTDTLYFLEFFQWYYRKHETLEDLFLVEESMKETLIRFNEYFFQLDSAPRRTQKHIATPARKSTCKRLNMFLRWMVRTGKVDLGLWKRIPTSALMMPLDVHVERVARKLGLLKRKQRDWLAVEELTAHLRKMDPKDPVKYDFALFGIGVIGEL